MSVQVEDLGKNMVKLTVEIPAEAVDAAIKAAYNKQKNRISIPGFRKGKVPQMMIEKMYGPDIFYEDAANILLQEHYPAAVDESGVDVVSQPTIDISQLEKGKPFVFTADVAKRPEVTLGKYNGVTVTKIDVSVSEEEIDAEVEQQRNINARNITVTDRPIQMGDTAVIDYEGFSHGVAFEGGKGENHSLEIGSHSFIDTFEDKLVGTNVGDEVEVNVTFPANYHAKELENKPAVFKVKVKAIHTKELPEIDDEFAGDVSEFDTLEEYKASVKEELTKKKADAAKARKEDEALSKIIEASQMDIPDLMVETQAENMYDEQAQRMQYQGMSMDMYMQYTGMTQQMLLDQLKPQALSRIQARLVLEAVVEAEQIEVSEEEMEKELASMAENYKMEVEKLKEIMGEESVEQMKDDLAVQKAADLIVEQSVETEEAEEAEEAGEAEA